MKPDVLVELKALRLHGMAGAWADLVEQGGHAGIESSRWLIEHLLQAEGTDRAMRSVSHQMKAAKFPVHRDLAGFDFEVSPVDRKLVTTLATTAFTDEAHNVVLIRFSRSTAEAKKRIKAREQARKGTKPEAEAEPF